jgi:predicted amidohydrolase YtcJ
MRSLLLLAALAPLAGCQRPPSAPAADLVLRGGRIYTVSPAPEWAEALAIRGETVVAVGTNSQVEPLVGEETTVVDLEGRLVLPGFIDGHIHFLEGALVLDHVKLDEARSLQEMLDLVKAYSERHPDLSWIQGMGWIYTYVEGGRLPTRQDLDAVISDRPVYLQAYDGHTAWVNSQALEVAGVTRHSKPLGYGEVVKDPRTGEPTGVLKETGAMELVRRAIPEPSREDKLAALRRAVGEALRRGVTSIQIAHGSPSFDPSHPYAPDELDLYEELDRRGELPLRVYFAMSISRATQPADLDNFAALKERLRGPRLKAGAVKIVMDGVIESHTAGMLEPYADDPSTSGKPDYSQAEIDALIADLDRRGFQIFTHAIGDRSVRMVLDAYQKAAGSNPPHPRRHRIEHIEVVSEADIPRFARLGILASMQPYHASPDITGVWARNVGKKRVGRAFAWKSLRDAGARLVHGSDWPVVTLDPLVGLHAAVTREDLDGKPAGGWIPEQCLTLSEAIRGYTKEAAYGSFDDDVKGSLEAGKLADLVVLSEDLFKILPRRIAEVEVLLTVVGGKAVYVSPGFGGLDAARKEE